MQHSQPLLILLSVASVINANSIPKRELVSESDAYGSFINVPFKKSTQFFFYLYENVEPFSDWVFRLKIAYG